MDSLACSGFIGPSLVGCPTKLSRSKTIIIIIIARQPTFIISNSHSNFKVGVIIPILLREVDVVYLWSHSSKSLALGLSEYKTRRCAILSFEMLRF